MRLIDADALAEVINKMVEDYTEDNALTFFKLGIRGGLNDAYRAVINFPTLDYAPVVHGEWMPIEEPQWNCLGLITIGYKCSECGREAPYNNEPYCHCGARMDGGKSDVRITD